MKEIYFFTPKETVELLGITDVVASRRKNTTGNIYILTRADMAKVQPIIKKDEKGNDIIPENYVQYGDLVIHKTITPRTHEQALKMISYKNWVINK